MSENTKIFISRRIPEYGINLLKAEGYDLTIWKADYPIPQDELIAACKNSDVLLSLGENKIIGEDHFWPPDNLLMRSMPQPARFYCQVCQNSN